MTVHYISPYAVDKNIGRAYNEACALIPAGDWICIIDQDVMFLEPHTKTLIHNIAAKGEWDLLGCMTNRLGTPFQLWNGEISDNPDISYHMGVAAMLSKVNRDYVRPQGQTVAGMLMLFPKILWNYVKFTERTPSFDVIFTDQVRRRGGRIGLMTGVYVFHLYRFGQKNPGSQIKHLLP